VSAPSDADPDASSGYIRGGAGTTTGNRTVFRNSVAFCLAVLAILVVVLAIQAAHQNSRSHRLKDHGVAVRVTVTRCLGTATGTGITVNGFVCRGGFDVRGRHYTEVIHGSSRLLTTGEVIAGVIDPAAPSTLAAAGSVGTPKPAWHAYIGSAVCALLLLLVLGFAAGRSRRPAGRAGLPVL
jgi:hypothetical protein